MISVKIEKAFDLYASTSDHRERQRVFSELVSIKALPKQIEDPRFAKGLVAWQELLVKQDTSNLDRLLALAELMRIGRVAKGKWMKLIGETIRKELVQPLPPCKLLKDADERLNLARACVLSNANWLPNYIAQSIADEDSSDKARTEFLILLLSRTNSLVDVFTLLADAFSHVHIATVMPGESMAKRLTRTLTALRPVLLTSLLEAGENAGKKLDEWLRTAMRQTGKPNEEKTQIELTRAVALTLHDLVRTRFSMATNPDTFIALKMCRGFFSSASWPTSLREVMNLLVQDVSEALLLLGKQDVPQQAVLDQLELVCGLKERAKVVAGQLADRHTELPERIRDWLRRGRLVTTYTTSSTLQESLLDANDAAVGIALIECRKLGSADDILQRIIGTIEIYDPELVRSANGYMQQVHDTLIALRDVASRRGISLKGIEGERIEFMPKYFEPLKPIIGSHVTIKRPAVIRSIGLQGGVEVITKGLVE